MKTLIQNSYTLECLNGWSQDDVVRQLGIYSPVFLEIENSITNINLYRPERVARSFDLSAIQLLTLNSTQQDAVFYITLI